MVALDVMETRRAGAAECRRCSCRLPLDGEHVFLMGFGWFLHRPAPGAGLQGAAFPHFSRSPKRLQIRGVSGKAPCPVNNRFPEAGRLISFQESKSRWSEVPSKLRNPVLEGHYVSIAALQPAGSTVCPLHLQLFFDLFCSHPAQRWSVQCALYFFGGEQDIGLNPHLFPLAAPRWTNRAQKRKMFARVCSAIEGLLLS